MRRRRVLVLVCILVLVSCASPAQTAAFDRVNESRATDGVDPLGWNARTAMAAQDRAELLGDMGYIEHRAYDLSWLPDGRSAFGENVGVHGVDDDPDDIHAAYMASPSHRANVLNPSYRYTGIGIAERGDLVFYVYLFWG